MVFFLGGFVLGLATSWFWFYQLNPAGRFQQLLQKEIDLGGYSDLVNQAYRRMDYLEERCYRLERRYAGAAGEKSSGEAEPAKSNDPGRKREQVLLLREAGRELAEIVRRTGLSKGEIELILSLQERRPGSSQENLEGGSTNARIVSG